MKDFRTLPPAEKLEEMASVKFWWRKDYPYAEEYMLALINGNQPVIADYECFGDRLRLIIENKAKYAQGFTSFGFTGKQFGESGWLVEADFLDCEEIVFGEIGHFTNSILLGRGPNGKWTHAVNLWSSKAGCTSGLSVYGPPFASRGGCLKHALEYFILWHEEHDDKKTAPALRKAKVMLDAMTGRKPVQMSLFDL
jgi:hypothetical protein